MLLKIVDLILYLCEVDSKESHKICRHAEFIKSFETCPLVRIEISPDLSTCLLNKDLRPENKELIGLFFISNFQILPTFL